MRRSTTKHVVSSDLLTDTVISQLQRSPRVARTPGSWMTAIGNRCESAGLTFNSFDP